MYSGKIAVPPGGGGIVINHVENDKVAKEIHVEGFSSNLPSRFAKLRI
jgi:hypothetical protein